LLFLSISAIKSSVQFLCKPNHKFSVAAAAVSSALPFCGSELRLNHERNRMKVTRPVFVERKVQNHNHVSVALCLACSLGLLTQCASAQVVLSGVLQQGADSQTGHSLDSPIWNTLGNEISFANIYLTQPNQGYTGPFLNFGNGDGASISYSLGPGLYQFYFFVMGFWDNNPGTYGLNLFFGGDNTHPGIAAFSPANMITATAVQAGQGTLSLTGDGNNEVPAPGSLTYTANGLSVTLTGYGYGEPGVFGGPVLDRVGNLNSIPDGYPDSVGVFTLSVATVPEPSVLRLGFLAVLLAWVRRA
jgi:hypothetical protein